MKSYRERITGWAALLALLILATTSLATAANWPPNVNLVDGAGQATITITNGSLSSTKNLQGTTDGINAIDASQVVRGGAAIVVLPELGGSVTSITASSLNVSGYTTTITADNNYDTNAFGPLTVFGSQYAATATGRQGIASDGSTTTSSYVTDLTSVAFNNVSLTNNTTTLSIVAHSGLGTSSAFGGGARLANLPGFVYDGGNISGNTISVVSSGAAAMTSVHANGGGFAIESDFGNDVTTLRNLTFSNNTASVLNTVSGNTDPATGSNARGGAIYVVGYNNEKKDASANNGDNNGLAFNVSNTTFTGNKAVNSGLTGSGSAAGGAVFTNLAVRSSFTNTIFSNNTAQSSHAGALGGAIAMVFADNYGAGSDAGTLQDFVAAGDDRTSGAVSAYYADFNKVTFSDNTATGASALGGAIYADKSILLSEVTFSGNKTIVGGTATANAIHLANATTHANFYDLVGKKSTDNDGISGAGDINKYGAGALELYGVYNNHSGEVNLTEGNTYFKGDQTFGGTIDVSAGALITLENTTRATNAVVQANNITLASGAKVTAKVLNAGDGSGGTNETAHFAGTTVIGLGGASNVYRLGGSMVENEQYVIIQQTGGTLTGSVVESVTGGLWGDYDVYASGDAVWAELVAGTGRSLGDSGATVNNRNIASAIGPGSANYDFIVSQGWDLSNLDQLNEFYRLGNNEIGASTTTALSATPSRSPTALSITAATPGSTTRPRRPPPPRRPTATPRSTASPPAPASGPPWTATTARAATTTTPIAAKPPATASRSAWTRSSATGSSAAASATATAG